MNDRTRRAFVAGLLIMAGTIGSVQAGPVEGLLAGDFDWTTDTVILKPDPSKMPPATPEWSQVNSIGMVHVPRLPAVPGFEAGVQQHRGSGRQLRPGTGRERSRRTG